MARIRGVARKSTGGRAPRKTLSHPMLREWQRRNPPPPPGYEEEMEEVEEKEVQTFPSTSDVQVQNTVETKTVGAQTDYDIPIIKVQKDLYATSARCDYLEDELVVLRQKLHRAERLQKELMKEKTSICTKECCKNSL